MAINFPHNPNVNDVHTESSLGKSWKWDGTTWLIYSSSTTGIGYADLSVTTEAAQGGGSLTYNNTNGQFTFKPAAGSGGGATNFTGLGDTPSSLTAGKWLKVNAGGTALEWTDAPSGNDTNDYLNTASLNGTTLTLTRTGTQSLSDVTVDLSSLNSVPTNITVANENTDIECYPLFTTTATGNLEPKTVTSFKLNSSSGQLEAGSFKKTGGSSSEFLKADGSIDTTTYLSSAPSYALNDLSDVDATTGVQNGKILKYNGTSWEVADDQSGAGGSSNFTGLSDTPNSLTAGKWLKVNVGGTALEWTDAPTTYSQQLIVANATPTSVQWDLVPSVGVADSITLTAGTNVTFSNADADGVTINSSGATTLGELTDVNTTGAVNNKILKYNGTSWVVADDATGGGGGSSNFTGLSDTPGTLTAGKWLKVNAGATALEWTDAPSNTNTTYDLAASADSGNAKITLSGSDSTNDDVIFTAGGGISYAVTGNTVEITSANSLGGLSDTTISGSPTDNYVLTYDSATSKWEPQPVPSGSTPNLNAVLGAGNTSALAATVGDFTCSNLTVNGTTTTVNSNTVNIGDSNLTLNSDETGTPSQNGGITIERGTSTNVEIRWNENTDKWQFTNDGTNYSDIGSSGGEANVQVDWNQSDSSADDFIKNKPTIFSGSYNDLTNKPTLFSGSYNDLSNKPTLFSGNYDDLSNKPNIPAAQIQSDWNQSNSSALDFIKNKPSITSDTNDYVDTATFSGTTITLGRTGSLPDLTVDIGSSTVPIGTIVMYNGDTAPAGWCLCDGVTRTINNSSYTPPDLRDKFIVGAGNNYTRGDTGGSADAVVVTHSHTGGNTGNQSADHTHDAGNYSGNTSTHNGHTHDDGNYGTSTHNGHTHGDGNYSGNTSTHNGHSHSQSGSGSGNTGNQSANHYHTIGGNKPDGSPGTFNVNTGGGNHGHSYKVSNGHPQSNMTGIQRTGGDDDNATNNTDILSSGGSHNHSINLTGVTTGGISNNHTHSFNFNIGGNTGSDGDHSHNVNFSGNSGSGGSHSHNVSGDSGSGGNHSHNVNFSGNSGNQSANHTHSFNVGSEGVSGTGKNLPPYYAITFIIKTP